MKTFETPCIHNTDLRKELCPVEMFKNIKKNKTINVLFKTVQPVVYMENESYLNVSCEVIEIGLTKKQKNKTIELFKNNNKPYNITMFLSGTFSFVIFYSPFTLDLGP